MFAILLVGTFLPPLALSIYGAVFGLAAVIGQALGGLLISLDIMGLGGGRSS
ncbi:hypothetical protein MWN33_00250 [Starkeya koreensis]|uniref:Major facilitator superfamily (MFS) profile domain-containing protein n=1 Tax=Ancylobacter koreensis TaxID=266121 RepID=A0ABT0DGQ8_9HYPH|nr:hypothetical protein [Ancylobacter koreensis]MCK0206459.1 hypothetical protein [Ancylobacter koreensis]